MILAGEALVTGVDRRGLWAAISAPETFAASLPSVEAIEREGAGVRARINPATGLGTTPFDVELELGEVAPERELTVRGRGRAPETAVTLDFSFEVVDDPAGARVGWRGRVVLSGLLRSLGQRVLPAVIAEQVDQVLQAAARAGAASSAAPHQG